MIPNLVFTYPSSKSVLNLQSIYRGSETPQLFGGSLKTHFVMYQPEFMEVLGPNPSLKVVAEEYSYPFAHEAGVWIPSRREVYFTSNLFIAKGENRKQIVISKISVDTYEWENISPSPEILTANGGTNYNNGILICSQGQGDVPGGLIFMSLDHTYSSIPILNNYYGRPFNSPNDVVIYPLDGTIWFTDPSYGISQNLRSERKLPNHVYCFDPNNSSIRVVADGIHKPNGISFSYDNKTCYITDTQTYDGFGGNDDSGAATVYAYDIIPSPTSNKQHPPYILVNKRVFAYVDCGAPDGIKCDTAGNVYAGCKDGINIWNSDGVLIGKILIPEGVANFCFTDPGTLFIFNENRIYEVRINTDGALNP